MTWYKNSEDRFGETGKKGDAGEDLFEEYLKSKNISYEKKTDPYSQTVRKIDFIVEGDPIDVKTNVYKDYLAVEVKSRTGDKGWIYTTEATFIYCIDLENKNIYRYNVKDMAGYVSSSSVKWKTAKNGAVLMWVPREHRLIEKVV